MSNKLKILISQESTNDPTVITNKNTLNGVPTYIRNGMGNYSILSDGLFLENRTQFYAMMNYRAFSGETPSLQMVWVNESRIDIITYDEQGAHDDALLKMPITIQIMKRAY